MKCFGTVWVLLLLCISPVVYGQVPLYKNFTVNDGLPSSTVYGICQDREGFIWIGSNNGVSRFDGTSFKVYTTADGLSDNFILKVYQDSKNRIWFLTLNGKLSFFKDGRIHNEKTDPFLQKADMQGSVSSFNEDAKHNIWFYNNGCIKVVNPENQVRTFDKDYFARHLKIKVTDISLPWINENGMLSFFSRNSKLIVYNGTDFAEASPNINLDEIVSQLSPRKTAYRFSIMQALKAAGEKMIVADYSSIIIFKNNKIIQNYNCGYLKTNSAVTILEDNDKNLWISTVNGLVFFEKGRLNDKYKVFFDKVFFADAIQDREKNLWFGTLGNGIFMIPAARTYVYSVENTARNNIIAKLGVSGEGNIMAGSINGNLFAYDKDSDRFSRVRGFKMENNRSFYAILGDRERRTWIIGGNDMAVYKDGRFTYYSDTLSWFKSAIVSSSGSLWVGGAYHLAEWKDNRFYVRHRFNEIIRMYALLEAGDSLLVGTEKGLYVYRHGQMDALAHRHPAFAASVNDIRAGPDGSVWAATRNDGIFVLHKDKITYIRKKDGLLSDNVGRMAFYGNTLLVANGPGVSRIKFTGAPFSADHMVITKENLPVAEVSDLMIKDSMMWLATSMGIIKKLLNVAEYKMPAAPSYITGVIVNHKNMPLAGEYDLAYRENNIELRYTGISFSSFGPVNYRYRLVANAEWNYTHATSVALPSLSPGDYFFEVQTQNASGEWNPAAADLKIHINAPFWRQWWFIALANALLILAIALILRQRVRNIRTQEKIKQKNLKTELQALRAQLNPHFIFNSLNSIQDFVLNNQKYEASAYLADFARLMRMILDNSRKQTVSLNEEYEFLQYYIRLEQLRFHKKFDYKITIAPEVDRQNAQLPSMFLQPFVENAILHGLAKYDGKGLLTIDFSLTEKEKNTASLRCTVTDNGIGRRQSAGMQPASGQNHHATAMQIIHERIDMYNAANTQQINFSIQDLENINPGQTGTSVIIDFPQ